MRNAEVIRQWQILREVESARAAVTIRELAEHAGVTTRTIRRDLQALQEAGFAIYDEGEEHDTKRWKLDAAPFRSVEAGLGVQDVAALYLSRSIVEALSAWPLADELRAALGKLESALNPRMREFLAALPQVVSTKAAPGVGGARRELVDVTRRLFEAVRDRHLIEMRTTRPPAGAPRPIACSRIVLRSRKVASIWWRGCPSRRVPHLRRRTHRAAFGAGDHVPENARTAGGCLWIVAGSLLCRTRTGRHRIRRQGGPPFAARPGTSRKHRQSSRMAVSR